MLEASLKSYNRHPSQTSDIPERWMLIEAAALRMIQSREASESGNPLLCLLLMS